MPLYSFRCPACGQDFDRLAPLGAETAACGCGSAAQRVFAPATAFKVGPSIRSWDVQDARGRYRVSDFAEAHAETYG